MKRPLFIIIVMAGCVIKDPGYSVLLGDNIAPSQAPTCSITANSTIFVPFGILDLSVATQRCFVDTSYPCYIYNPQLLNQMQSVVGNATGFANQTEVRSDANDWNLDGFYATYEVRDTPPIANPGANGDDVAGPKSFIGAGAALIA